MAPSDFIDILIPNIAIYNALSQFCLAAREVPLAQANSLASRRVFELIDNIRWNLNIQKRVECLDRQESSIT